MTLIYVLPDYDPQEIVNKIANKMGIKAPKAKIISKEALPSINELINARK